MKPNTTRCSQKQPKSIQVKPNTTRCSQMQPSQSKWNQVTLATVETAVFVVVHCKLINLIFRGFFLFLHFYLSLQFGLYFSIFTYHCSWVFLFFYPFMFSLKTYFFFEKSLFKPIHYNREPFTFFSTFAHLFVWLLPT